MCGRYTLTHEEQEIADAFLVIRESGFEKSWNLAPTQQAPIVGLRDGARAMRLARWGLIPSWAKDAKIGAQCVNARSESAREKPAFRAAFAKRRCVVPASGWYEWRAHASVKEKTPFYFTARDRRVLAVAGLWESWRSPEGTDVRTFTLLTCGPNAFVAAVHDRMPVLLDAEGITRWLEPTTPVQELVGLLAPAPEGVLEAWAVARAVGSPKVNGPSLIEPVAA